MNDEHPLILISKQLLIVHEVTCSWREWGRGEEKAKRSTKRKGKACCGGNNMGAILIVVFGLEHMHTAIQVAPACLSILPDIL